MRPRIQRICPDRVPVMEDSWWRLWCIPPWPSLTKEVRGDMGGAGGSFPMLEELEKKGERLFTEARQN